MSLGYVAEPAKRRASFAGLCLGHHAARRHLVRSASESGQGVAYVGLQLVFQVRVVFYVYVF